MKRSKNYSTRIEKHKKGYACSSEPLYDSKDFLYYFENRLQQMVRDEFDAHFRQSFYNMPF